MQIFSYDFILLLKVVVDGDTQRLLKEPSVSEDSIALAFPKGSRIIYDPETEAGDELYEEEEEQNKKDDTGSATVAIGSTVVLIFATVFIFF